MKKFINRIFLDNSLSFMKKIPDKSVDLVIKCRHIWFGNKASVKWDVVKVVIDTDITKSAFKFSDDYDEPEADNTDDEDEPDEDESDGDAEDGNNSD